MKGGKGKIAKKMSTFPSYCHVRHFGQGLTFSPCCLIRLRPRLFFLGGWSLNSVFPTFPLKGSSSSGGLEAIAMFSSSYNFCLVTENKEVRALWVTGNLKSGTMPKSGVVWPDIKRQGERSAGEALKFLWGSC